MIVGDSIFPKPKKANKHVIHWRTCMTGSHNWQKVPETQYHICNTCDAIKGTFHAMVGN